MEIAISVFLSINQSVIYYTSIKSMQGSANILRSEFVATVNAAPAYLSGSLHFSATRTCLLQIGDASAVCVGTFRADFGGILSWQSGAYESAGKTG
jgi:hypothetical protein